MGNIWGYGSLSTPPTSTDLIPIFHGGQTKDIPVNLLLTDNGTQVFNIKAFGAVGDGQKITDASLTLNSATLISPSGLFKPADTGKKIIIPGAASSGATLNTTITYVSSTQITLGTISSATLTNAVVFWGTDDSSAIQTTAAAIQNAGGGIFFAPSGIYISSAPATINKSNFTVRGVGNEASQFVLNNSSASLFTVDSSSTGGISNILFERVGINCASQTSGIGIKVLGGNFSAGDYVKYISFIDCKVTNVGNITQNAFGIVIYSGRSTTDRGPVTDILVDGCIFDTSVNKPLYMEGGQIERLHVRRCKFLNGTLSSISWNQPSKNQSGFPDGTESAGIRSNKNFIFEDCYFNNPNKTNSDIRDLNKSGMRGLIVKNCFFDADNTSGAAGINSYCIDIQGGEWGVKILGNTFWQASRILSIGQSNNGPWFQTNATQFVEVADNFFYKSYQINDPDSTCFATWHDNVFFETVSSTLGGQYGRHWGEKFHDNIIYNCNTASDGVTINFNSSAMVVAPFGISIKNNLFIDDRLLANPTTAPVLTTISGGSQGSRTYYVKYTWENDTGETLGSSEASIVVPINQLLVITHPYTSTYGPPTGAKRVNWYVGTGSGVETKQSFTWLPWAEEHELYKITQLPETWTEPVTGLITGTSLPGSNTTKQLTIAGVHEISGSSMFYPNIYEGNDFRGINGNEIHSSTNTYKRVQHRNYTTRSLTVGNIPQILETIPYVQGNITGATTFDVWNGEYISATFTGNVTATVNSGHYIGQTLTRVFTMGGAGSLTYTKASNEKLVGGNYTPSAAVGAIDKLITEWDGTNWIEVTRSLNVS